jgi:hypothetical protein
VWSCCRLLVAFELSAPSRRVRPARDHRALRSSPGSQLFPPHTDSPQFCVLATGGGTVFFVSPDSHRYLENFEERYATLLVPSLLCIRTWPAVLIRVLDVCYLSPSEEESCFFLVTSFFGCQLIGAEVLIVVFHLQRGRRHSRHYRLHPRGPRLPAQGTGAFMPLAGVFLDGIVLLTTACIGPRLMRVR